MKRTRYSARGKLDSKNGTFVMENFDLKNKNAILAMKF